MKTLTKKFCTIAFHFCKCKILTQIYKGENNMGTNTQSRKWLLTINNPEAHGVTHETIKVTMQKFKNIDYWCMGDEKGDEGDTYHIHLFIVKSSGGILFSTVKNRFPMAHIDYCSGTAADNRAYVFKEGDKFNRNKEEPGSYEYRDSKKNLHKGIHYDETNEEFGECPVERQGARNDLADLYDMIKNGYSTYEILEEHPQYMFQTDKIERVRQVVLHQKFSEVWRDVDVTYIWGLTGEGKTRSVVEEYGYKNIYRVTNYKNPFDSYHGQDVVLFDEFRSSVDFSEMLTYMDGHPVEMKARFSDKQACFHKVIIISNMDIREQYRWVQREDPHGWDAFLRRIDCVKYFKNGKVQEMPLREYMLWDYWKFGKTPFDEGVAENGNKE